MSWMCIIPFQDDSNLEQDSFLKQFRSDWPKLHVQGGFELSDTVASLAVDGATVMFAKMPAPIPDASVPAERKTLLWPNPNSSLAGHKTHWIVTVVDQTGRKSIDRARLLTKAVHSFLSSHAAALGVFWGGHGHPVSSATFREVAKKSFRQGEDPLEIWVEFQVGWLPDGMAGGKSAGYTRGLSDLDLMDLETVCAYESPTDLLDRLHGLAQYLLAKGLVIRDGDTIGHDANEKIRVIYSQSKFGGEEKVMRLDYQPPLGHPDAKASPPTGMPAPASPFSAAPPSPFASSPTSPPPGASNPGAARPSLPMTPPGAGPLNPWEAAAPGAFGPAYLGPSGAPPAGAPPGGAPTMGAAPMGAPPVGAAPMGAPQPGPYYNPYSMPSPAGPGYGPPMTAVSTSPCAIIGLCAGIVSPFLFCCMLNIPLAIFAVIMGHIGLVQVKRGGGRVTGRGMAIAALVLGYLSLFGSAVLFGFAFLSNPSSSSSYTPPKASSSWDEESEIPLPNDPPVPPPSPTSPPGPTSPPASEFPSNPLNPAPPVPPAPPQPTIPAPPPSFPSPPNPAPAAPDEGPSERPPGNSSAQARPKGPSEPPPLDPQRVVMSVPDMGWPVQSLEFSPDGKWLAVGKLDSAWQVYEVATGKKLVEQTKLDALGQVTTLAWSPDGKTLYTGGWKGAILAWEFQEDGTAKPSSRTLKSHQREVKALVVSPDGRFVISGDQTGELLWQQPGEPMKVKSLSTNGSAILAIALASPPTTALATNGRELLRINLREAQVVSSHSLKRLGMQSASFSSDQTRLFRVLGNLVGAVDSESGEELGQEALPVELLWVVRAGRSGDRIVTGGRAVVRIWDAKTLKLVDELGVGGSGYVQSVALSPDGAQVAAIISSAGQTLHVLRVEKP